MNIYFGVTKQCNMRCKYCYVPEYNKSSHKDIDIKAIASVQLFLKKAQKEKFKINKVILHGAEPTILSAKTLSMIVEMFYSYTNTRLGMQTNGINLTKEYLSILPKEKIDIGFSIDGQKELHDLNRPNSYDTVMKNIHTASSLGFMVSVLSVINKDTIKYIDNFFQWCKHSLPVLQNHSFKFIHSDIKNNLNQYEQELFIHKCITKKYEKSLQILKKNICITNGNDCIFYEFDIDGNVYSCNKEYNDAGSFANWKSEPFYKIQNKRIHLYRDNYIDDDCIDCEVYSFCKGGCPSDRIEGKSVDCFARKFLYHHRKNTNKNILM